MTTRFLFQGEPEVLAMLQAKRRAVQAAVDKSMEQGAYRVQENSIGKVSGEVLNHQTGQLARNIKALKAAILMGMTAWKVAVSLLRVPYARIHEYGGIIHHPGSDKLQAWRGAPDASRFGERISGMVFTRRTRPHDIPMPERSYLRSALAEETPWILNTTASNIKRALK